MTGINYTVQLAGSARAHTGALPALDPSVATPRATSGSRFGEALRDSLYGMFHGFGMALPATAAIGGALLGGRLARAAAEAGTHAHIGPWRGGLAGIALAAAGAIAVNYLNPPAVGPTELPATALHPLAPGHEHAKVMTFNIRYGLGPNTHDYVPLPNEMDAIAATIRREQPDIVLLQEVHDFGVDNGFTDQFAALDKRLRPDAAVFSPAGRDVVGKSDGNVVMTFHGFGIDDARALNLEHAPGAQARGVADVLVRSPGGAHLRVLTSHTEGGASSAREYAAIGDVLAAGGSRDPVTGSRTVAAPTIISGDWNNTSTAPGGKVEARTFGSLGLTDAFTANGVGIDSSQRASYGGSGLDRIYTGGGMRAASTHVVHDGEPTSDHQPVVTDVTF